MAAKVTIDRAALTAVGLRTANRLVTRTTRQTLNRAKILAPVDTGRMRAGHQSTVTQSGNQVRGQVISTANYSKAVHDGTRPHTIRPRRGKVLKFKAGGRTVYARSVKHPGSRGRPWLFTALQETTSRAGFRVAKA